MLPRSKDEQAAFGAGVKAGTARLGQFGEAILLQEDEWAACIEGGTHDGLLAGRSVAYLPVAWESSWPFMLPLIVDCKFTEIN